MRETQFIRQSQEKWREFEQALNGNYRDPEQLSELFVQTTDDLSYSRTFYPNRSVRVYLNDLAQRSFLRIYRASPAPVQRLWLFWTDELPQIVYESRAAFRLSLAVFAGAIAIGILSCAMDSEFLPVILGDDYVEMTRENIRSGDPMAVYKQRGEFNMFLAITFNNVFVSFLTFIVGLLMGLGTLVILINNGVMLGAFQYFFYEQGLFWESFLTIWIHGTLEISSIVIAGAAGITMGRGLAFPGTYTRLQAFQRSARRGLKILLGTVPIFIIAGFLESYLTRHTETPDLIRGLFILLCLSAVLFYFVFYPLQRQRSGRAAVVPPLRIPPERSERIDFGLVRTAGEALTTAFSLLRRQGRLLGGSLLLATLLYTAGTYIAHPLPPTQLHDWMTGFGADFWNLHQLYTPADGRLRPFLAGWLSLTLLAAAAATALQREQGLPAPLRNGRAWLRLLPATGVLVACFVPGPFWSYFLLVVLLPWILLWAYGAFSGLGNISLAIQISLVGYGRMLILFGTIIVMALLFFTIVDSVFVGLLFQLANWVLHAEQAVLDEWNAVLLVGITNLLINFMWLLFFVAYGILFHSLYEIYAAPALRQAIRDFARRPVSRTNNGL